GARVPRGARRADAQPSLPWTWSRRLWNAPSLSPSDGVWVSVSSGRVSRLRRATDLIQELVERGVHDRGVALHHRGGLPPTHGHQHGDARALVDGHGRAMVAEIVKREIVQPDRSSRLSPDIRDVETTVRLARARVAEDVFMLRRAGHRAGQHGDRLIAQPD